MLRLILNFSFSIVLPVFAAWSMARAATIDPYVIYGEDGRTEVFEESDPARQILAESVLAVVLTKDLSNSNPGEVTLQGENYGRSYLLCEEERFFEQTDAAFCTAFLVAENIVATAGHSVRESAFCSDTSFVFGYMKNQKGRDPNKIKSDDVYGCKKVLYEEMNNNGGDYALVELDRAVVGHVPLEFAPKPPRKGESVFTIGHPSGLPAKISSGGAVRENQSDYFVVNLDTFSGNSGSPVFNDRYEVTGVLVRGEQDFIPRPGDSCHISFHCPNGLCRGEDVSNGTLVEKTLERLRN